MSASGLHETFSQALASHQRGALEEAERLYRECLESAPELASAHNNLGVIAQSRGRHDIAVNHFIAAIRFQPDQGTFWSNAAASLRTLNLRDDLYGLMLAWRGDPHAPHPPAELLNDVGLVSRETLSALDHWSRGGGGAVDVQALIANAAVDVTAWILVGIGQAGRHARLEAAKAFAAAACVTPGDGLAWINLSAALCDLNQSNTALAVLDHVKVINPQMPMLHYGIGTALVRQWDLEGARSEQARELALNPSQPDAWRESGSLSLKLAETRIAAASLDRAIMLEQRELTSNFDHDAPAWPNVADASVFSTGFYEARLARAMLRLSLGDGSRGWRDWLWQWLKPGHPKHPNGFSSGLWTPKIDRPSTILIYAEQGYGDTLQFVRYIPLVESFGHRVILEVQPSLKRLVAELPGPRTLIAQGASRPAYDYQCPLLALPALLYDGEAPPPPTRYVARPNHQRGPRVKVGLVWRGNPDHANDRNRSLELDVFKTCLAEGPFDYVSLQRDAHAMEREGLGVIPSVLDTAGDWFDTALRMADLDLVITVDTALAHLASSLGIETWVLLCKVPDWRWGLVGTTSPWYPTMTLYRQETNGAWSDVLARVRQDLLNDVVARLSSP